jgi:hypothetical protein
VSAIDDHHLPSWDFRRRAGWDEFQAARRRFLVTLARQSALVRLEHAWSLPAHDAIDGREQRPALRRLGDVQSRAQGHSEHISPQAGLPPP